MEQYTYLKITTSLGDELIQRPDPDGQIWLIPEDPNNSDYQAYLASLDETSTK